MASTATAATPTKIPEPESVPAVKAWIVAVTNSGKLAKWTARHHFFGSRRRANDVSSTASRR